jgi:hypothetical protein
MPPKKIKATGFTLKQGIDYINTFNNAENSKKNWIDSLTTLVNYDEAGDQAFHATTTKKEQAIQYADY